MEDVSEFIEVTQDTSSIVNCDTKIPTLVVGYNFVKELCSNVSVLNKNIGKNLYWTFSKRERRIEYEKDIIEFNKTVRLFADKYNPYEFIDMISGSSSDIGDLFMTLCESCKKIVYKTDKMLYVYIPLKRKTIGISLDETRYMSMNDESVLSHFKSESFFVPDTFKPDDGIFNDEPRKIPFLYYLSSF
jgi:hypothetical protein